MKQLIQNFKTGELYVDDVPKPSISDGFVLIENHTSLISPGTEKGTVKVGQASLIGKARQRPDLVAQVIKNVKKEGLQATITKVRTKLDSLKALGYSSAGTILASMDKNNEFKPGDRVACAGQDYASHAEIVSVPQNLVVRIPDNVSFEEASFTTLGAIAMQGVRQADPKLGENICVIGLGLLGQLSCQLLRANGCTVTGIDLEDRLVKLAKEVSADYGFNRNDSGIPHTLLNISNGRGFDSVIITAATPSNDPIELAAEIARKKGKVIVVGAVKMDIPRDPHFYRKELDLRMSCSYGPGRYDSSYEEQGIDYPSAYVPWTEKRNMEAFLLLLSKGLINVKPLITHSFEIEQAEKAFDLVLGKAPEPSIGILLQYGDNEEKSVSRVASDNRSSIPDSKTKIGFIGAGSFAQSYLIPNVKETGAALHTVVNTRGITAKNVANKFGFGFASSNSEDVIKSNEINTVFIATPHNTHASYVVDALTADKHVFVEKPLAIDDDSLNKVIEARQKSNARLMVGFNRRFSQAAVRVKELLLKLKQPPIMNFRVNAGSIPKDHWIQNPEIGGGRIIGEVCHFIDLMLFLSDSYPVKVFADYLQLNNDQSVNQDNVVITLTFKNGAVGSIIYTANGDTSLPKERLEVFCGGTTSVIHDFRSLSIHQGNKEKKFTMVGKGHKEEVKAFISSITQGTPDPIDFAALIATTRTSFRIIDSLRTGLPQFVDNSSVA